jgi:hypothetical protein
MSAKGRMAPILIAPWVNPAGTTKKIETKMAIHKDIGFKYFIVLSPFSVFLGNYIPNSNPHLLPSNIMERKRCQEKKRSQKNYFEIS